MAIPCAAVALLGVILRALPEELQSLPYVPVLVAATPWFMIPALLAFVFAVLSRRWITMLTALACLGVQGWWQQPFYSGAVKLPASVYQAMSSSRPDTGDMIARVMTFNVYKGRADAQRIVEVVRDQKVEVLALQETTNAFIKRLEDAGIHRYLPYSQVSSSDGVSGNGIWSATKLSDPVDDEVNSSASFMPAGTVTFGGGEARLRFVSVHTTAPVPGYWSRWRLTLDELARMRSRTGSRYVFMGDFNATTDHTPFRDFLGERFTDAARQSGHGFTFTWPTDKPPLPRFAGIDHVVLDQGIVAGQMQVVPIDGSDHAALLATIVVQ
ncbi:endonuclease/exonuclease/phosphatase family protein [Bifidobacterium leontopitheci]|uniref:endonuclease/exonuclease/phosphatase family protein n=1 Tax=Bifidobacterium leontopitheci TaxID=2650774 RepID=UPI001D02F9B2|nr:endonuclease/exonuclease/phosphatase family protein [Bifidobacterium leontopitheci]